MMKRWSLAHNRSWIHSYFIVMVAILGRFHPWTSRNTFNGHKKGYIQIKIHTAFFKQGAESQEELSRSSRFDGVKSKSM